MLHPPKKHSSLASAPAAREALADRAFDLAPEVPTPEAHAQPEQATPQAAHSIAAAPARIGKDKGQILQPKLHLGAPNDPAEQEADQVADQVLDGQVSQIQRAAEPGAGVAITPALEAGVAQLRGGGQPLAPETRGQMEPRFGHSFAQVRVHTDAHAANLAQQIQARAFTVGSDVAFAPGQYQPQSSEGQRLLAHELTHVAQQGEAVIRRDPDAATASKPMIMFGSTGDGVRDAQKKLNEHGAAPPLNVDGIFGSKTLAATRAFQGRHGLTKDGIIGPKTWGALDTSAPGPAPEPPGPAPEPPGPAPEPPGPAPEPPGPAPEPVKPREEVTEFGTFTVYPQDTKDLPVADRKEKKWPIREDDFTQLKAILDKAKSGKDGITIVGSDEFKLAVSMDLAWLMTQGVGREFITALMGTGKKLKIEESAGGNTEVADNFNAGLLLPDKKPGPGTNVTVKYNTKNWDPYGGGEDWQTRPPAIGMAHEFVHAWADMTGTTPPAGGGAVPEYENQAVGLGDYEKAIFSENKFRAAFGLPLRPRY